MYQHFTYNDDGFQVVPPDGDPDGWWKSCLVLLGCLILLLLLLALCGCRTTKSDTVVVVRDSIRTEVRTETVYVPDTIPVVLPPETVRVVAPDTLSRVQTSVAISEAAIRDGLLHHSIWNKQTAIPVPVHHKETTSDSIVYKEKEVPVPYPVEVEVEKELSWWQQLRLWLGNILLLTILAAAGYGAFRLYMKIHGGGLL